MHTLWNKYNAVIQTLSPRLTSVSTLVKFSIRVWWVKTWICLHIGNTLIILFVAFNISDGVNGRASLLKHLTKTMEYTPKRVTKLEAPKMRAAARLHYDIATCKPKIQQATIQLSSCSKCCPLSWTRPQPWLPMIDRLSTTLCFSSALTEMKRCTENHFIHFC